LRTDEVTICTLRRRNRHAFLGDQAPDVGDVVLQAVFKTRTETCLVRLEIRQHGDAVGVIHHRRTGSQHRLRV